MLVDLRQAKSQNITLDRLVRMCHLSGVIKENTVNENAKEKLARWIFDQKITKREAAKMLGTHPSNLTKWLTGAAVPSLSAAFIIEAQTGINMEEWV